MLQGRYKDVADVTRMLQGRYKDATQTLQGHYRQILSTYHQIITKYAQIDQMHVEHFQERHFLTIKKSMPRTTQGLGWGDWGVGGGWASGLRGVGYLGTWRGCKRWLAKLCLHDY